MKTKTAVILAGGKGTRLWPLTKDRPKPMVLVADKPFLYWQLRYLQEQGVEEVLLLISHLGHVIQEYFQSQPIRGLKIKFAEEPTPAGTGGALKMASAQLPEVFWLLNGDSFLYIHLGDFESACSLPSAAMAVADPALIGVPANVRTSSGLVTEYRKTASEEDGLDMVDAGVYRLKRDGIHFPDQETFDLGEIWPPLILKKQLASFPVHNRYFDIGTVERLRVFERHLKDYFDPKV
ncbi:MAG: sugar phosphate nucleotidyltransferase [Bdellovibrionales bacterium]